MTDTLSPDQAARRDRLAVLARADTEELKRLWNALGPEPEHTRLRGPEAGLVMLRGRVGATGEAFNVGEATVSRASVRLADGTVGHAMALGTERGKVLIGALIDALCHDADTARRIEGAVVAPLLRAQAEADAQKRRETAATRVDFFTMVRGED